MPLFISLQECQTASLVHADSSLSLLLSSTTTCTNTASDTMCTTQQVSSLQLGSGFQVDLTDSQSTGEFPSQLTFRYARIICTCRSIHIHELLSFDCSDGEFGSGANPNSTAENQLPLRTLPLISHDGDGGEEKAHPLLHAPHIEHTLSPPTSPLAVVVDHQTCPQGRDHHGEIPVGGGHREDEGENKEGVDIEEVNDGDSVNGDGEGDHNEEENGDHGRNDEDGGGNKDVDQGGNKAVDEESGRDDKKRMGGRDGERSEVELNGDDVKGHKESVDVGVGEDEGSSRHGGQQGGRESAECGVGSDGAGSEPIEEEVRKPDDIEADEENTSKYIIRVLCTLYMYNFSYIATTI